MALKFKKQGNTCADLLLKDSVEEKKFTVLKAKEGPLTEPPRKPLEYITL